MALYLFLFISGRLLRWDMDELADSNSIFGYSSGHESIESLIETGSRVDAQRRNLWGGTHHGCELRTAAMGLAISAEKPRVQRTMWEAR